MALDMRTLYVAEETTFSVDPSPTGSSYTALPARDITFTPTQTAIDRPAQGNVLVPISGVRGAKSGTLSFKLALHGTGQGAGEDEEAKAPEFGPCLESATGTQRLGKGTATTGTWTANGGAVADASGIVEGDLVMIGGEVRQVTTKTANSITLNRPLSAVPAASTVVYAAANYAAADTGHKSLTFVANIGDQQWTLTGCKGTWAIEGVNPDGVPLLNFTFQVDNYTRTTKAALPPLYAGNLPKGPVVLGAELAWGTTSTPASEFAFNAVVTVEPVPSIASPTGRSSYEVTARAPAGSYKTVYSNALETDFAEARTIPTTLQIGNKPTNTIALAVPAAEITAMPGIEPVGKQVGQSVSFRATYRPALPDFTLAIF